MKGMRKGKHYNQGWLIRKSFSKLIFRLYIERYIDEKDKGRLFLYDPLSDFTEFSSTGTELWIRCKPITWVNILVLLILCMNSIFHSESATKKRGGTIGGKCYLTSSSLIGCNTYVTAPIILNLWKILMWHIHPSGKNLRMQVYLFKQCEKTTLELGG